MPTNGIQDSIQLTFPTGRLCRKTSLTAEAPGNVITAQRRTQLLANALLEDGAPGHQAEVEAIIEHRKASA